MSEGKMSSAGARALGFATGMAFGALLQKGRLGDQDVILKQMVLKDLHVVKTMATAVVVGGVAVHALVQKGKAEKDIKPLNLGGIVFGGTLFGAGLSLFGYCPGTSLAAAGSGKSDALAGIAGMMFGAGLFVANYPKFKKTMELGGTYGKKTLPGLIASKESADVRDIREHSQSWITA